LCRLCPEKVEKSDEKKNPDMYRTCKHLVKA
jgi:hypothetical protein